MRSKPVAFTEVLFSVLPRSLSNLQETGVDVRCSFATTSGQEDVTFCTIAPLGNLNIDKHDLILLVRLIGPMSAVRTSPIVCFFFLQLICSRRNKTQEVKQKISEHLEGKHFCYFFCTLDLLKCCQ